MVGKIVLTAFQPKNRVWRESDDENGEMANKLARNRNARRKQKRGLNKMTEFNY